MLKKGLEMNRYDFLKKHSPLCPIILMNIWDKESSEALLTKGINVQASSSYAVASYYKQLDGEKISFTQLLDWIDSLPHGIYLTVDIESGFALTVEQLKNNIEQLLSRNIIGINIEDRFPNQIILMEEKEMTNRIRAIKEVDVKNKVLINVRSDVFWLDQSYVTKKEKDQLVDRLQSYIEAGADCLFLPGLKDPDMILYLTNLLNCPINIMLSLRDPIELYMGLGISRISFGPSVYLEWLESGQTVSTYIMALVDRFRVLEKANTIYLGGAS